MTGLTADPVAQEEWVAGYRVRKGIHTQLQARLFVATEAHGWEQVADSRGWFHWICC